MIGFISQESEKYSPPFGYIDRFSCRLDRYEDGIDLSQNVGIVKCEDPATVLSIVIVENPEVPNRLVSAEASAPYIERNLCIYLPRVSKVVSVKDQRLSFCVKNPAKGPLALTVAVSIMYVNDVEIARDHKLPNVIAASGKSFLLSEQLFLIGSLFPKLSKFGFLHSHWPRRSHSYLRGTVRVLTEAALSGPPAGSLRT